MSAGLRRYDMSRPASLGVCICHGKCKLHNFHQRYIRGVIANTRGLGRRNLQPLAQFLERKDFVLCTLNHVLNAQLAAADVYHFGLTSGDDRNHDARGVEMPDSLPVTDIEHFQRFATRPEIKGSIG